MSKRVYKLKDLEEIAEDLLSFDTTSLNDVLNRNIINSKANNGDFIATTRLADGSIGNEIYGVVFKSIYNYGCIIWSPELNIVIVLVDNMRTINFYKGIKSKTVFKLDGSVDSLIDFKGSKSINDQLVYVTDLTENNLLFSSDTVVTELMIKDKWSYEEIQLVSSFVDLIVRNCNL